ncbi:tetratricopeptide repeat protein [Falsiroseomonas stagni]|uniref:Tetratricopeptide repeat-containing protein n=1 Tax=Falsiroseomonas stagni DSM 19981 TaxID=1123062 RepID=A0A1I4BAD5_9PROT|nr:hypothetical protein [Falsiroseomonas stagni]SFK65768.1 hypothetical protein SAMN02745775_105131 [Falsiroseomonas stagni DSM 19981]
MTRPQDAGPEVPAAGDTLTPKQLPALVAGCEPAEALSRLRAALAARPDDVALRIAAARLLRPGAPEEALALLRDGPAAMDPSAMDPVLGLEVASLLQVLKRGAEAASVVAGLAAAHPTEGRIAAMRGNLAAQAGDHALAAEAFATACRASPDDPGLAVRLARSLRDSRRPAEALAALRSVTTPQAAAERAYALLAMAELDAAGQEIEDLARAEPDFAHLPRLVSLRAEALGDMPAAADALARAMVIEPGNTKLLERRWRCLRLAGDAAGLAALPGAASLGGEPVAAALVETLLEQGDCAAAEALLATWTEEVARLRGGVLLALRRGDAARAAAHASAILARVPNDGWALWRQAEGLALAFRAEAAWARLRRLEALGALGRRTARHNAIGHLVNDMRLHPAATARLAIAATLPRAEAMAVAAELLRREPGMTAPALALVRAGVAAMPCDVAAPAIPARLHLFAAGQGDAQATFLAGRLAALHPGWAVQVWTTERLLARADGDLPPALGKALRLAPGHAMRDDLLRLGVLVMEGGAWVDRSLLCVASLAPLLPPGAGIVAGVDGWGAAGTMMVAARPGHAVLSAALEEACREVIGGSRESAWLTTGGGLLTRHLAAHLAQGGAPDRGFVLHYLAVLGRHLRPTRRLPWQRGFADWAKEA